MNTLDRLDASVASAFYGNFSELRDVQKAAIDPILSGRNVVLTSATGSGKTEAVMAPLISNCWREAVKIDALSLLYIAPTKALANDLEKRLLLPLSKLNIRVGIRHGDRDDLKSGPTPHVLITTPESLDVLLFRKDSALEKIQAVVLDEVHLLYNTQRGLQLSILLSRLRQVVGDSIQLAALSATIANLAYLDDFLMGDNEDSVLLSFPAKRPIDAQIRHVKSLREFVGLVRKLTDGRNTKLLVFANSRHKCEQLTGALKDDQRLYNCVFTHYSSLSAGMRVDTEKKFASMGTAICIATSTLELGIDIGDIDAVILWDAPKGVDSFLQRIGRGNRRSNKTNVVCLIPNDCDHVEIATMRFAALLDAAIQGKLPVQASYELFGAIGQQCLSIIASNEGNFTRVAELYELLKHNSHISREKVEAILSELASQGFLQKHGYKNRYGADEELYRLVDMRLIYGNFPIGSDMVDLFHGAKHLGEIPKVNLLSIRRWSSFRFAGQYWSVKKTLEQEIHLEPSKKPSNVIRIFFGSGDAVSQPFITDRMWRLMHSDNISMDVFTSKLGSRIATFIKELRRQCGEFQIPFRRTSTGIIYYTFAGKIVNRAVGTYAQANFKDFNIGLDVPFAIDWGSIPSNPLDYEDCFPNLFEATSEQSLYQKQLPLELQAHEYIQNWLKDESIRKILDRLSKSTPVEIKNLNELPEDHLGLGLC